MRPANISDTSVPIVITTTLDLRRKESASTTISSSSQRSSTSEGSEFKKSNLMVDGDSIDDTKPFDRAYTPATMSRTSISVPQNEQPSNIPSSLPDTSNLREFTSPTPSGDSSPPPAEFASPFTTLTRPGDEDLFVKVLPPSETTGTKDQRTQFILPSPPLTRVGTKSTQKSAPSRPGSGPRESRNVEGREELDITDARRWQDSQANITNFKLESESCSEREGNMGSSRRMTGTHLLRLDIPPTSYSPPLWEIIGPTEDSESSRGKKEPFDAQRSGASKRLIPKSSYYYGPPPPDTAFGTEPVGQIGTHHPREIVRIERDYSGGEIIQFSAVYPLEFEGRITPTQFLESINAINEILISAHSLSHSCLDNVLAFFTLQLSRLVTTTHYEKEMSRLHRSIDAMNTNMFNPVGLNIVWPKNVAFLFMEIEYY